MKYIISVGSTIHNNFDSNFYSRERKPFSFRMSIMLAFSSQKNYPSKLPSNPLIARMWNEGKKKKKDSNYLRVLKSTLL